MPVHAISIIFLRKLNDACQESQAKKAESNIALPPKATLLEAADLSMASSRNLQRLWKLC
jgi:hypothetical protein